ncbi:MAG: YlbF family regulator [Firmicutes bacterium]|nr:YlbF family regulator [Bacillota bacterium]
MDRNQIYRKATELGALLAETEEVASYRLAEEALLNHPSARQKLARLRELQEATQSGEIEDPDSYDEIDQLLSDLEDIPEAVAFEEAQDVVNALLQTVSQIIADGVISQPSGESASSST